MPRRQVARRCATLEAARAFVAQVRATVEAGSIYGEVEPDEVEVARLPETVNEAADKWLAKKLRARPNTLDGYRQWLSYSRRRFGNKPVNELTIDDVQQLVNWMSSEGGRRGQPLSRTTITDAVKVLGMALTYAVERGLIARNVAQSKSIEVPDERGVQVGTKRSALDYWPTTGTADAATIPYMATFREVSDLDPLAVAWRLTLCGFTRSEVLGFRWPTDDDSEVDIDLEAGEVTVHRGRTPLDGGGDRVGKPKSDARWRTLPVEALQPGTVKLLRAMRARQREDRMRAGEAWEDSGYLVVDELGRPIKPRTYSDRFARLCESAGVPRIKMHNVRHSLAQLMIERRIPLDVCAATLGHSLQVFMTSYVRQSPSDRIKEHARPFVRAA